MQNATILRFKLKFGLENSPIAIGNVKKHPTVKAITVEMYKRAKNLS